MDDLLRDFLTESNENLLRLDQEIVELEKRPGDPELLKSIFRTIHTIKGTCGFLDLARLESVAHSAENVLGLLRDGKLEVSQGIISDVLGAVDVIKEILLGLEATQVEPTGDDSALIARLDRWVEGQGGEEADSAVLNLPAHIIAALMADGALGKKAAAGAPAEAAAEPAEAKPARQRSSAKKQTKEPAAKKPAASRKRGAKAPPAEGPVAPPQPAQPEGDGPRLGDLLVAAGKVDHATLERVASQANGKRLGEALIQAGIVTQADIDATLKQQTLTSKPKTAEADRPERSAGTSVADSSLRVGVEILDQLMNLAGELVLTRNQLVQISQEDEHSRYVMPLQHLNRVTSELQEAVMKTRMQPIGNAWGKLPRLVRDLCQMSGKKIELEMSGAETELDRQILQAIQDPLTHMIRNSADHGVEAPEVRKAAGKKETGTIRLEAYHEGGQIIIEIRDDGKGLDVDAIRNKAVTQGLVRAEVAETLSESQIFKYIFEPGFSTAEKVTNVSGRGVGMDVVRSNIEKIGGAVELTSVRGKGTTFRIKIPLTLAILSALIVGIDGQSFAIPQVGVMELVRITEENRNLLETVNGAQFFRLRETLLPLVQLAGLLRLDEQDDAQRSLVVCQVGSQRFGLIVEAIYDTQEIVVKPIGRLVKQVPFYSGTTILGDGRVIMILDVPSIAAASHVAEQMDSAGEAQEEHAGSQEEERMSLVVFSGGGDTVQAVPLALVSRLEKIPADKIEFSDGRFLVQYRGSLLPIVPASPSIDMRAPGERPVIVFSDGDRNMGLAVEEIRDIVEDRLRIEMESSTPNVLGTAVIAGRSTEVLDVNAFVRSVDPSWFGARKRGDARKHVLLVDDSAFFLNLIGPALRSAGYEVTMTSDGQEALGRLEQGESFDVIVSDIDMPRVDGFELARRISDNPRWSGIPLLALTGRETQEDRAFALEMGFDEFLRKFDREIVIAAIENATSSNAPEEALV